MNIKPQIVCIALAAAIAWPTAVLAQATRSGSSAQYPDAAAATPGAAPGQSRVRSNAITRQPTYTPLRPLGTGIAVLRDRGARAVAVRPAAVTAAPTDGSTLPPGAIVMQPAASTPQTIVVQPVTVPVPAAPVAIAPAATATEAPRAVGVDTPPSTAASSDTPVLQPRDVPSSLRAESSALDTVPTGVIRSPRSDAAPGARQGVIGIAPLDR